MMRQKKPYLHFLIYDIIDDKYCFLESDRVILYSQERIINAATIEI